MLELHHPTGRLLLLAEERDNHTLSASMYDSSQAFPEDTVFTVGDTNYTLVTSVMQGFYSCVLYELGGGSKVDSFVLLEKLA